MQHIHAYCTYVHIHVQVYVCTYVCTYNTYNYTCKIYASLRTSIGVQAKVKGAKERITLHSEAYC